MSKLGQVVEAVEKYNKFVLDQVKRARTDEQFGRELINRWNETKAKTPVTHTPTGLPLPRLALPEIDEPGEIARYLFGEGLPGEFPFLNGAYREMYLEPAREIELSSYGKDGDKNDVAAGVSPANRSKVRPTRPPLQSRPPEEPTRLFSGLMLAEDTNERFHYLTQHQRTHRLSTAFDGPTLYGIDSDADGVSGKIGEGGVAIDTVEDMVRLYDGFDLGSPNFSASMTISGPAPIIMAMYIALARVSRRIWAIGMRDAYGAGPRGQLFKLHTQTSGRSLIAAEFKNNLTRTAAELILAYMNATNSCHSNSADEPFTTPSEEWIRLAAHGQAILLEESGIFKHTMNMLSGSPGMKAVERAVEAAILDEFREIERLGGVLAAVEDRFQRSQIQNAAHRYEQQIYDGTRPIIGLNRYRNGTDDIPEVKLARTPRAKQQLQVDRLKKFKKKNVEKAKRALDKLVDVVERGENCFPALLDAVEVSSLGQITGRLQEAVGRFRPMV